LMQYDMQDTTQISWYRNMNLTVFFLSKVLISVDLDRHGR